MQWILQIPVLFFSIIVHEFMHGYIAYRRGDDTAYLSGRLTFNPIPHIDPFGTIILPLAAAFAHMPLIGWAKPVPVNPYRMHDPRSDMAMVAAGGPLSNFSLAFLGLILFKIFLLTGLYKFSMMLPFFQMTIYLVQINVLLGIFNLIPVYPLDGSQILLNTLPYRWAEVYERHIPYGFYIILAFMLTGVFGFIVRYPMHLVEFVFRKMMLAV